MNPIKTWLATDARQTTLQSLKGPKKKNGSKSPNQGVKSLPKKTREPQLGQESEYLRQCSTFSIGLQHKNVKN